ncbi:MAG TPA: hypothetical protein VHS58_09740, partial [Acetobacteraceae bacterium]|nr:hypothetical protein [Acetobacteraceae bacterium]
MERCHDRLGTTRNEPQARFHHALHRRNRVRNDLGRHYLAAVRSKTLLESAPLSHPQLRVDVNDIDAGMDG